MAVEIVADPAGLRDPNEFGYVVAAVSDYVPVVQRIKKAVVAQEPLQVLVRDPACAVWLQRMAGSYSSDVLRYSTASARELLAERWQTQIPDDVTDAAILTSGFLQADVVPRSGQTYEDIVLEHYWGEFLTLARFPLTRCGELLESLDLKQWAASRELPLATRALAARKQHWLQLATSAESRELTQALFDSPAELKNRLAQYKLLRGYPAALGEVILGKWLTVFKNLQIDPTPVGLDRADLEATIREIRYYLNGLSSRATSQANLEAVLDQMSGFLREEFDWIVDQLHNRAQFTPTPQFIARIAERFGPIRAELEAQLAALRASIPPAYPTDPAALRTTDEWLHWAVMEYLPYRFWLEDNDRWDDTVAGYGAQYADWFYENYIANKYAQQNRWVFALLSQTRVSLNQGRKVLFIVIDNFNYKHLDALRREFARREFHVTGKVEPVWALMPTATEVSKWCLLAGEADMHDIHGSSYGDMLDKDWRGQCPGQRLGYADGLGDLKERRYFDEDLIVLNYQPIDTVLHKDEREIGTTHTGEVENYIGILAEAVAEFARRTKVGQQLDVYVCSDHGSTKVPPGVPGVLDRKFYRERAVDRHHRYITVPETRANNPTAYDERHCYIVRASEHGTRENYFIARGYDRFIDSAQSIYVHGGLTPEETIVPFLKLVRTKIRAQQPSIRLARGVVRYSVKVNLVFALGNPNEHDMTNIHLAVLESDLPGISVEGIPAGSASEVELPVRVRRQPGAAALTAVTVKGDFELLGQRFDIAPVSIPVEARSLVESKEFDFES